MKAYAEQIRPFIPKGRTYKVLGTDGFGRSDFRSKLREHFEINRHYIVVAALKALAEEGAVPVAKVAEAIKKYGINADKINPLLRIEHARATATARRETTNMAIWSKSRFPTSATSMKSRSSRCWSSRATPSRPSSR